MRLARWVFVLLLGAAVVLPGLTVHPQAGIPGVAELSRAAYTQRTPELVLSSVTPKAPERGDTVRIRGTLANPKSADTLPDVTVRLRVMRSPITSRSLLDQYARDATTPAGTPVYGYDAEVGEIPAGGDGSFTLRVPVDALGLSIFDVYLIGVEALQDGGTVAFQRTFLVYVPDDDAALPEPTRIGWLWPLTDIPRRLPDGTFTDDRLATTMTAGGRLDRLVDAAGAARAGRGRVPLTFAVDPELLDAARAMSQGYRVRNGDRTVAGEGEAAATSFLHQLTTAVQGQSVLALPYADADVAALVRHGLYDDLTLAVSQGHDLTRQVLGVAPATDLAWPPGGLVDQPGLDALAATGSHAVVLRDSALPLSEQITYTPDPVAQTRTASGPVTVLLSDTVLDEIVGSARPGPGSTTLVEQRFLAETALITAERPNASRGLVVAPPRRWNPPPGFARTLLADTARAPWLTPASLSSLRREQPSAELSRQQLTYPAKARHAELTARYLHRVRKLHTSLARFSAILNPLPVRIASYNLGVLRTESASLREHGHLAHRLLHTTVRAVAADRAKVHIVPSARRSLASSEGTVPVTLQNRLDQPVTVRLEVRSRNTARMRIGAFDRSITIAPQTTYTVAIPVRVVAAGVAYAEAQLMTPRGKPYGDVDEFTVLSTAYGTVAVVITAVALAVLFAGSGYRLGRRLLAARRSRQ